MARDPAHVGGAPEHVARLVVEHPSHGNHRLQQEAAGGVLHALGLAGRARSVEDEQRMLRVDPGRLAVLCLTLDHVVPPFVARRLHVDGGAGAFVHDHVSDFLAAAHRDCLVHRGLERNFLAAAELSVGGDDLGRARVDDPFLQALRGKAAEHHRVRRADTRAGLHRGHHLDRHRHVDEDAVALLDAVRLQRVRELAHLVVQLLVADARDLAVVRLEDNRRLVRLRLQVPVEAVIGGVELPVVEPFEKGRIRFVQHFGKWLVPKQIFLRQPPPEPLEIPLRFVAQGLVGGHAGYIGLFDERRGRRKDTSFVQNRFDLRRHDNGLLFPYAQ